MSTQAAFTARQARFIDEYLVDGNGAHAAIRAGYAPGSAKVAACRLLTGDNRVKTAIQARQRADATRLALKRNDVLAALLEAVDQAREQRNPMAMISGLREVGKMLGFYAVETKRIELGVDALAAGGRFERMTDAELMAVIANGGTVRSG